MSLADGLSDKYQNKGGGKEKKAELIIFFLWIFM